MRPDQRDLSEYVPCVILTTPREGGMALREERSRVTLMILREVKKPNRQRCPTS